MEAAGGMRGRRGTGYAAWTVAVLYWYLKQGGLFDGWVPDCLLPDRTRHASATCWMGDLDASLGLRQNTAMNAHMRLGGVGSVMKTTRLLTSVVLMSAIAMPWASAQNTVGAGEPGLPSSVTSGSYGPGLTGPGLTGPGSYGSGSYSAGSFNPGVGASTAPPSPFAYFSQGGAAAGTVASPSVRSR